MAVRRWLAPSLFALTLFSSVTAKAEPIISLEKILFPPAIAERIHGSGVEGRDFAVGGGGFYKMDMASLRVAITDRLAVRANLGMASQTPLAFAEEQGGLAEGTSLTVSLWQKDKYSLDVDVEGVRASYGGDSMTDATLFVAFRENH